MKKIGWTHKTGFSFLWPNANIKSIKSPHTFLKNIFVPHTGKIWTKLNEPNYTNFWAFRQKKKKKKRVF